MVHYVFVNKKAEKVISEGGRLVEKKYNEAISRAKEEILKKQKSK